MQKFNAFIPAAGLGTRLYPLTQNTPKALVKVAGKPLLEHLLLKLKTVGVSEVVINVHHFAQQIIDFLASQQNFGLHIHISDEQDQLLNTGGGLKKALHYLSLSSPILVHNVDVFSDLHLPHLLEYHAQQKALSTLVVRQRDSSRCLLFNNQKQLCGWKNKETGEEKIINPNNTLHPFAFSGIYIASPTLISKITEQGAFSVIDLLLRLAKTERISSFIDSNNRWMDLGKYGQIKDAEKLYWE